MPDCQSIAACPFFNDRMTHMPFIAGMMKRHYCQDHFEDCARFMIKTKLGKEKVPENLFPNERDRAMKILGGQS